MNTVPGRNGEEGPGIIRAISRFGWLILVATVFGALAGYSWSVQQAPIYEASSRLVLATQLSDILGQQAQPFNPDRYLRGQAEIATSPSVLARAAALAKLDIAPSQLAGIVTVEPQAEADIMSVRVHHESAETAAAIANAVASAYQIEAAAQAQHAIRRAIDRLEADQKQLLASLRGITASSGSGDSDPALVAEREATVQQLAGLGTRLQELRIARLHANGRVQLIQAANVPTSPASPQPLRNALIVGMLALLLSTMLVFWLGERYRVAHDQEDPRVVLDAPLLGTVPKFGKAAVLRNAPPVTLPSSDAAEAYRLIATSIALSSQKDPVTVVISGAERGNGASVTALNIAVAASRGGHRVTLVDADLRTGGLSHLVGTDRQSGFAELLERGSARVDLAEFSVELADNELCPQSVRFVPAGAAMPEALRGLTSPALTEAVSRLGKETNLVIFDAPPLLGMADSLSLAACTDGVVLVVARETSLSLLREARRRLDVVGASTVGYVFNRRPQSGLTHFIRLMSQRHVRSEPKPRAVSRALAEDIVES